MAAACTTSRLLRLLLLLLLHSPGPSFQLGKGHLMPLGHSGPNHPVDESDGFVPPAIFMEKYRRAERPVVMRGAVKESAAFRKWTDAYLRSRTLAWGQRCDVKYMNKSDPLPLRNKSMAFLDFIDSYNTSDVYLINSLPAFLGPDVVLPFSLQCAGLAGRLQVAVLWLSSGRTRSTFHRDHLPNINCVYRGHKRALLVNYTQYSVVIDQILDVRAPDFTYSSVDPQRVDLGRHPLLAGMDFHVAELRPGDCLHLPTRWMHFFVSTGSTLAVNVWLSEEPVDPSTCRQTEDRNLTMDKVDFVLGRKYDVGYSDPANLSRKPKAQAVDAAVQNIADSTMATLLSAMTGGGPLSRAEAKRFIGAVRAIDVNGNGRVDQADFELSADLKETLLGAKRSPKIEEKTMGTDEVGAGQSNAHSAGDEL